MDTRFLSAKPCRKVGSPNDPIRPNTLFWPAVNDTNQLLVDHAIIEWFGGSARIRLIMK
jgi:hypothetical protein